MSNLISTLDRILGIYAPILNRWMSTNPEAVGVVAVLRRQNPGAYLLADVPEEYSPGYREPEFEAGASKELEALVEPTMAVLAQCSENLELEDSLSIKGTSQYLNERKTGKRSHSVILTLKDESNCLCVTRGVTCLETGKNTNSGNLYLLDSAPLRIITNFDVERTLLDPIIGMESPEKVVDYLFDNNILNKFAKKETLLEWIRAYPEIVKFKISTLSEEGRYYSVDCFPQYKGLEFLADSNVEKNVIDLFSEQATIKFIEPLNLGANEITNYSMK